MSSKKEDPQLTEISKKLDTLIRLSALNLVRDIKTQKDQIALLSDSGFEPKEIADILLASRITVNSVIYKIRKERSVKEGNRKHAPPEEAEVQEEVQRSEGEAT